MQYPKYYNLLFNYFLDKKLKYFVDGSFNYNKFPKDICSNSNLERYNKTIKIKLGEKRLCNLVIFLNFINEELERIDNILGKNENISVLYKIKSTKFGIDKYNPNNPPQNNINLQSQMLKNENEKKNISEKWLKQKGLNCRYNSFITIFYFAISLYISQIKDKSLTKLEELNNLILKLSQEINNKNYLDIITFCKKIIMM